MFRVRTTKTASGKTAVQIVHRGNHRIKVVKHIGTADGDDDRKKLVEKAQQYIMQTSNMNPLFPEIFHAGKDNMITVDDLEFTNTYHSFAYEFLSYFYERCGFGKLDNSLLKDLVIMRIIEPCSKLHAVALLREYFGKQYGKTVMYEKLPGMKSLKVDCEKYAVAYAKKYLSFDFSLVFYDVTTLYFETFKEDAQGFRKPGFSKDNKANQPQIVIGLIVTSEGFPVSCEVFEGNTFEGNTFMPTITKFRDAYDIKNLIVVADAAMISFDNIKKLKENDLSYIVGARIANLKRSQMEEVSKNLGSVDGSTTQIETERGLLVCDFSAKRYKKDQWETEKQIVKAEKLLEKNEGIKRTKFLMNKDKERTEQILNTELIEKTKLLLGIKGYYTNLTQETHETIITHYHNLWHVEKAFRIAKSDLEARPVFHHKKEIIEVHILIVFISLCVAKSIELLTNLSIKKVRDMIWRILDIEFTDTFTKREYRKRMATRGNKMVELLSTLQDENQLHTKPVKSGGSSDEIIKRAIAYKKAGAEAISFITEKHYFKGDISFIPQLKKTVSLPILQKDFVVDEYQIYQAKIAGSDALLLIVRYLDIETLKHFVSLCQKLNIEPVVEINNKEDLAKAIETRTKLIAVNARDLQTFEVNVDRACELLRKIPDRFTKLGFSGIHSSLEVKKYKEAGARGVLVGTELMKAKNIGEFLLSLRKNVSWCRLISI